MIIDRKNFELRLLNANSLQIFSLKRVFKLKVIDKVIFLKNNLVKVFSFVNFFVQGNV